MLRHFILAISFSFMILGQLDAEENGQVVSHLSWDVKSDQQFSLQANGNIVWRFNADPADASKPYFDPLSVVGSPSLTLPKPSDHPWHLAHWFSWKYINGVNYWETDKNGRAQGETFWETPKRKLNQDGSANILLNLGYRKRSDNPSPTLVREVREISISAPAADDSYMLDWGQKFTAEEDVVFDRTPIPGEKNGVAYGGYAGLAIRLSNELKDIKTVASNGENIRKREGNDICKDIFGAFGAEQNGVIDGQEYGIAILTHPDTPRSGDWYVIEDKDFTYFNPAILLKSPYKLEKGKSMTLRYRVIVHKGRWDADKLNKAVTDYVSDKKSAN
ncbi:MAG: PmoA family protein [Planctomycetaceae bacterium]|jgi:hypothetical protein|nr:PmoA family protein [Planctomycetaceae bacterium]